jgi:serine/threonine protein kinase
MASKLVPNGCTNKPWSLGEPSMDDLDRIILETTLVGGWRAIAIHEIQRDQPNRCRTYYARDLSGQHGFVKVLPPSSQDLEQMRFHLEEFFSEKAIVELCGQRNMRRIVRAIAFDKIEVAQIVPVTLHYLIFEWAEHDMRALVTESDEDQIRAALACLHHMATALHELHFSKIAHQNVRPAAVLRFKDDTHKLGDFRHAQMAGFVRSETRSFFDPAHAAPELLYGVDVSAFESKYAIDLYQLGALGLHLLTGVGATVQLARELSDLHHWRNWEGDFADVVPYLNIAHERVIENLRSNLPVPIQADLTRAILQLTAPDPFRRGHPGNPPNNKYGLERYISLFELLRKRFDVRAKGAA